MCKGFEVARLFILMFEGAHVDPSPRSPWIMACARQQPRQIQAFRNASEARQSAQGVVAGRTQATTALAALTIRNMDRASDPRIGA